MVRTGENSIILIHRFICVAMLAAVVACASSPRSADVSITARADKATAHRAAEYAQGMVGKPYRYGGSSPSGFDCSGLVQYSYSKAGLRIPRTTRAQRKSSIAIGARSIRVGDLVFFDQEGRKSSHVGIYIGAGRFVHAPSSGKHVRVDKLKGRYWKKHFVGARRM